MKRTLILIMVSCALIVITGFLWIASYAHATDWSKVNHMRGDDCVKCHEDYIQCEACENHFLKSQLTKLQGSWYCKDCLLNAIENAMEGCSTCKGNWNPTVMTVDGERVTFFCPRAAMFLDEKCAEERGE